MKVLVIGLGSIAEKHIRALKNIDPLAEIFALRSRSTDFKEGVINIYELNNAPSDIDFIIISNPTNCHATTIEKVLGLQKPLFIEKPVLHSLEKTQALGEKIRQSQLLTYIGCNMRFHPLIGYLKEHVSGKRINEVNVYCGSYLPEWRPNRDFRTIYSANRNMGGGVHLDLIHELDYVHYIFGKPNEVQSAKRSASSLEIDAIDYANYLLSYDEFSVNIILNYYRRDSKRYIEIIFDDATWHADLLNSTITDLCTEKKIFSHPKRMADTYFDQMNYFIECIQSNTAPMNDFSEAAEILKTSLHDELQS
jgi:predicted dehydrogenase